MKNYEQTNPELFGQSGPGFTDLDFSTPHDELVEAELGTIAVGELSPEAQAAMPELATGRSSIYEPTKGPINRAAYERQNPVQKQTNQRGVAMAQRLLNKSREQ